MKLNLLARLAQRRPTPVRVFITRADAARDEGRWRDAAALYLEALRLDPRRGGVHIQAAHMFKEAGELGRAEHHYREALALRPNDADLALQMGHFFKVAGQLAQARASYERAAALAPDWAAPTAELGHLREAGWRAPEERFAPRPEIEAEVPDSDGTMSDLKMASLYGRMAPENLPRPAREMVTWSRDSVNLRQFGVHQNSLWGIRRVARGVEAIRGFCIASGPLLDVQVRVNGIAIHRGSLMGPYELEYEADKSRIHKYVFNVWCDFSQFAPGQYELELRFTEPERGHRSLSESFVVEPPLLEEDHPDSDGVINLPPTDTRSIEEQVAARPSAVHEAVRPSLLPEIRSILVARADQLGDLVASIPGIYKLRELFPDARIVGLFGPANVDLARTLNVFDDFVVVDFGESMYFRTRILPYAEQVRLRDELAPYAFDLAIDLSQSLMSRPLLALSGARFTYGFKDPNWPRLTASVDDAYYDPKNRREIAAHSARIVALVERLGALMHSSARVIRRDDLTRGALGKFGIAEGDRYAVLHTGARIVFSRWAHYLELASRLLADTDLKIVLFTGDPKLREKAPADLAGSDRFIVIDGQLPFDDFDALLSFCSVYIGNDSGPKHLASLRGVPVVSIHSARINWSEWGQEHSGVIISRKVPCAGCSIYHDVDECGKDFVCVKAISLNDVYQAVRRYV